MDKKTGAPVTTERTHSHSWLSRATVDDLPKIIEEYRQTADTLFDKTLEAQDLGASLPNSYLSLFSQNLIPFVDAVDHRDYDAPRRDDDDDYVMAIIAGRVKEVSNFDVVRGENRMLHGISNYIAEVHFNDDPELFLAQGTLKPRDYRTLINRFGKQLTHFDEDIEYGKETYDASMFQLGAVLQGISMVAVISESEAARKKAIDYLEEAWSLIDDDDNPAAAEARHLGKLVGGILRGTQDPSILETYKNLLGGDWDEALSHYVAMNMILKHIRFLNDRELVTSREVIKNFRDRLHTQMLSEALSRRADMLISIRDSGGVGDHIDTDSILNTNELFAQLDWTVLPPGEQELREQAEDIVSGAQHPDREVKIDLERLNILKGVKDAWGADKSYYARGRLKSPRKALVNGHECPDEYIILVLQELGQDGLVTHEHAIAESPIAGPHALYVFRADVSEGMTWRQVYSVPKKEARSYGARAVKHTKIGDKPLVETMTEKVTYLITCQPQEFAAIQFSGSRLIRIRKLGAIASRPEPLEE